MFENTNPYTISSVKDSIRTLNKLLCEVDYHYLNNCKIVDVIILLKTIRDLMNDPYQKVCDLLDGFAIIRYPMIYLHSNNVRWDLGDCYLDDINTMLGVLQKADGLVYLYESNNYRMERGL